VFEMASRAPGPLGLVQDFVNTRELDPVREELGTPDALAAWLRERSLLKENDPIRADPPGRDVGADLARALDLREAIRRLLFANNGGTVQVADLALLDRMAVDSGLRPRFPASGRVLLEPAAPGVRGALGRLLAALADAMQEGTWSRLKACAADDCGWAFYDSSKNRSGHWCSMRVCGNRAKARQFRQRRRPATSN
jgi:predicted RNA-binding Zn ribbon-like protein